MSYCQWLTWAGDRSCALCLNVSDSPGQLVNPVAWMVMSWFTWACDRPCGLYFHVSDSPVQLGHRPRAYYRGTKELTWGSDTPCRPPRPEWWAGTGYGWGSDCSGHPPEFWTISAPAGTSRWRDRFIRHIQQTANGYLGNCCLCNSGSHGYVGNCCLCNSKTRRLFEWQEWMIPFTTVAPVAIICLCRIYISGHMNVGTKQSTVQNQWCLWHSSLLYKTIDVVDTAVYCTKPVTSLT